MASRFAKMAAVFFVAVVSGCGNGAGTKFPPSATTEETLRVVVDAPLARAMAEQASGFSAHYPATSIDVVPERSGKTLLSLLRRQSGAVIVNGNLTAQEDSLLRQFRRPGRKEPVARDAIICIVNRQSPLDTITVQRLSALLSGKNQTGTGLRAWTSRNDFRLLATLRMVLDGDGKELYAMQCDSDSMLFRQVASDPSALGLLYLSSYRTLALSETEKKRVRMLQVASNATGSRAVPVSEQYLFDGRYPLGTPVYYIYVPGTPLAAGFGSWLSRNGQKTFERNYLAPIRQVPRTIILK